jgi:hypothetical protein
MEQTNGECCKTAENLILDSEAETSSAYTKVYVCKVCGRHHYGMTIKPVEIKLRME